MRKFLSLENFIYLTIFLLPSYLIKLSIFGLPTNVLEILILISLVWTLFMRVNLKNYLKSYLGLAVGLMLGGLMISTLVNGNYLVGLGIIKGWFVLPLFLALVAKNVIPQERSKSIYTALYFSGLAVAVVSYGYYFAGQMTFDGRLEGFFNSPNYLAMYLAPAILIGAVNLNSKNKIREATALFLILVPFYLTYSYAAWVSLSISLLVIYIVKEKQAMNCKKAATIFLVLVAVVWAQWHNQKFVDLRHISERSSLNSRLMIWSSAGRIAQDNWIWGIGPGNFQDKYLEYQKYFPPYLEWAVPHPHSLYLALWLYSGIFGLLGFALLLYFWVKEIIKKEQTALWLVSFGIMLLFLLHGLVDTTYFKNDLASIFWLNLLFIL